jgi:hypothetical protein
MRVLDRGSKNAGTRQVKGEWWYLTGGAGMRVLDRRRRNAGTRQGEQECWY